MAQSGYKVGDIPNPRSPGRDPRSAPVMMPEQPGLGDVARRNRPQPPLDPAPYVPDIGAVFGGVQPEMMPEQGMMSAEALQALMRLITGGQ